MCDIPHREHFRTGEFVTEEPSLSVVAPARSAFRNKRFLFPFGVMVTVALVGTIALFASGTVALPWRKVTVVRAMLASKRDFFEDGQVRRMLMAKGIQVQVTPVASRELAQRQDLGDYDFVMPSGQAAADLVRQRRQGKPTDTYRPFFSPIVLGTYREYAEALYAEGVATPQGGGEELYYDLSLPKLVELMEQGKFWDKLKGSGELKNGNRVIAQTPDPCQAYSGATYLGMVAFARNGNEPPADEAKALLLAAEIKPLFDIEGQHGDDLGPKYTTPEGRSFGAIMVIYEHQYLAHQFRWVDRAGRPDRDRVLLYPEAQHETAPELLAFTAAGNRIGDLVMRDPDLRRRAVELGFRVYDTLNASDESEMTAYLRRRGLPVPTSGVHNTEAWLPDLPLLEKMIVAVGGCR